MGGDKLGIHKYKKIGVGAKIRVQMSKKLILVRSGYALMRNKRRKYQAPQHISITLLLLPVKHCTSSIKSSHLSGSLKTEPLGYKSQKQKNTAVLVSD